MLSRSVYCRYLPMRLLNGNIDVVAPISAPMLQHVAMPVHDRLSTPGPKYSTMAPVPPLTVRMPAYAQCFAYALQLRL